MSSYTDNTSDEDNITEEERELQMQIMSNCMIKQERNGNKRDFLTYYTIDDVETTDVTFPTLEEAKTLMRNMSEKLERISKLSTEDILTESISFFNMIQVIERPENDEGEVTEAVNISLYINDFMKPRIDSVLFELSNPSLSTKDKEKVATGVSSLTDLHYAVAFRKKQIDILHSIICVYEEVCPEDYFHNITTVLIDKIRVNIVGMHRILYSILSMKKPQSGVCAPLEDWNLPSNVRGMRDEQILLMKLTRALKGYKVDRETDMLYKQKTVYEYVPEKCKIPVEEFNSPITGEGALIEFYDGFQATGKFVSEDEVFIIDSNADEDDLRNLVGYVFHFADGILMPNVIEVQNSSTLKLSSGEELEASDENVDLWRHKRVGDSINGDRIVHYEYPDGSSYKEFDIQNIYVHSYMCCDGNCRKTKLQHMNHNDRVNHVFKMKVSCNAEKVYETRFYEEHMKTTNWVAEQCNRTKDISSWKVYTKQGSNPDYFYKMFKRLSAEEINPRNRQRYIWSFKNGILHRGDLDINKSSNQINFPKFYPYKCKCLNQYGDVDHTKPCECGSVRCLPMSVHSEHKTNMNIDSNSYFDVMIEPEMFNKWVLMGPKNRSCHWGMVLGDKYSENLKLNKTEPLNDSVPLFICSYCGKRYKRGDILETCEGRPGHSDEHPDKYPPGHICFTHINSTDMYSQFRTPFLDSIFIHQKMTQEDIMWMKCLLGRMLFKLTTDSWEILTWIIGKPKTGKTVLTRLLNYIFPSDLIGTISNNTQSLFGLSAHVDKFVLVGSEMGEEFANNIDGCILQQLCSSERVELAQKHKVARFDNWTLPIWFCGNLMPNLTDNNGSIFRRLVTVDFHTEIGGDVMDSLLFERIKSEIGNILISCSSIYMILGNRYRDARPPLSDRFERARIKFIGTCAPFERFVKNAQDLVRDPNAYIREDVMHKMYRRFVLENGIQNAPDPSKHTTIRGVIGRGMDIEPYTGKKVWPPVDTHDKPCQSDTKPFRYYVGIGKYEHFPPDPQFNQNIFREQLKLCIQENGFNWEDVVKEIARDIQTEEIEDIDI